MKRWNLPEIEDSPRTPAWLRDAITGYLQVAIRLSRPYAAVLPMLVDLLRESEEHRVVDLASGGGGPWPDLAQDLFGSMSGEGAVTLTDLHPNRSAIAELERTSGVTYWRDPVSALDVPAALGGARTMFTGLHHFSPQEVRAVLRSAQESRVAFLAAEATHRSIRGVLVTLLVPLLVMLLMPRVRPRRAVPLILTYLPPVLPAVIWWDGFASTLKTYRAEELKAITMEIEEPGYSWHVEEVSVGRSPIPVTMVVGRPAADD